MTAQSFGFDPYNVVETKVKLELLPDSFIPPPLQQESPPPLRTTEPKRESKIKQEVESDRDTKKCSIKFNFGGDLRRILVHPDDTTFRFIVTKVKEIYPTLSNPELYYTDDEGDSLKITGDDELAQAFDLFPKILKLSVLEGSILVAQRVVEPSASKHVLHPPPTPRETRSMIADRSKKRTRAVPVMITSGNKKKSKRQKVQGHLYHTIGGNRLTRSPPSQWVGEPIKKVGTKLFYSGIIYQEVTYHVGDVALLNSNVQPFPIGRIVSMWEQAKKRWVCVNWFFRGDEVRQVMASMAESPAPQSSQNRSGGGMDTTMAAEETLDYVAKSTSQEVFLTGHKDDNYPSTLEGKVEVRHVEEIPDLEEYLAQDSRRFFYHKYFDLTTCRLTAARTFNLSPLEAMDFDLSQFSTPPSPTTEHRMNTGPSILMPPLASEG